MSNFVPFEPGMEGKFVPYEAIEEGLVIVTDDNQQPQQVDSPPENQPKNE